MTKQLAHIPRKASFRGLDLLDPAVMKDVRRIILDMAETEAEEDGAEWLKGILESLHEDGMAWTHIAVSLGTDRRTLSNWRSGRVPRVATFCYGFALYYQRLFCLSEWLLQARMTRAGFGGQK